jgi:CHAT domain-containing protein
MNKTSYRKLCYAVALFLSINCWPIFFSTHAVARPTFPSSASLFSEVDQLIARGELEKAIQILDKNLEEARKKKDVDEQVKSMHRLQIAHYFRGGGRRGLVYCYLIVALIDESNKKGISVKPETEDSLTDCMISFHKGSLETGGDVNHGFPDWIDTLVKREKLARSQKDLVKIYSGLAYLHGKVSPSNNEHRSKAKFYFEKLMGIDIERISMEPIEKIHFLITYVEVIKMFHDKRDAYQAGLEKIRGIGRNNKNAFPLLTSYFHLHEAYLLHAMREFQMSLNSLRVSYLNIEKLPNYIKFLTLELLSDNYVELKGDLQTPNVLYSKALMEMEKIRNTEGSDLINLHLQDRISQKQLKVRTRVRGTYSKSLEENDIRILTIIEAISRSSDIPYPYGSGNAQLQFDNMVSENVAIENHLLKRGDLWDALVVSEVTRGQITRSYGYGDRGDYSVIVSGETDARYCYERMINCDSNSEFAQGLQIAGGSVLDPKSAIFPMSIQRIAKAISSQSDKPTIVQYFYDFKSKSPNEIHFYVFKPESDPLKVKPIVRCLNLQTNAISVTCAKYKAPVNSNSSNQSELLEAQRQIASSGLGDYIKYFGINTIASCQGNQRSDCNKKNTSRVLRQFYQLLIDPISDLLPTNSERKVVFIPQGDLFAVPFSALQDANGKYLIEKATVSVTPSITLMAYADKLRAEIYKNYSSNGSRKYLIVGNPNSGREDLPSAAQEAQEISQMYGVKPILGNSATKEKLLADFYKANMIHLAAHADIDNENPLNTSILLSPSIANPSGRLLIKDIDNRMKAELVVLSTCSSSHGTVNTNGINGFSSQLMLSGNPTQVVSLWPVQDDSTRQIMTDFHKNLLNGQSKSHALRQALLKGMNKYKDPYYWAAFMLVGNAQ